MRDCVSTFNVLKKRMDNKSFSYDQKQRWESEIEDSINNYSIEKFINDFCGLFKTNN